MQRARQAREETQNLVDKLLACAGNKDTFDTCATTATEALDEQTARVRELHEGLVARSKTMQQLLREGKKIPLAFQRSYDSKKIEYELALEKYDALADALHTISRTCDVLDKTSCAATEFCSWDSDSNGCDAFVHAMSDHEDDIATLTVQERSAPKLQRARDGRRTHERQASVRDMQVDWLRERAQHARRARKQASVEQTARRNDVYMAQHKWYNPLESSLSV